jgi:hypothetical protein
MTNEGRFTTEDTEGGGTDSKVSAQTGLTGWKPVFTFRLRPWRSEAKGGESLFR